MGAVTATSAVRREKAAVRTFGALATIFAGFCGSVGRQRRRYPCWAAAPPFSSASAKGWTSLGVGWCANRYPTVPKPMTIAKAHSSSSSFLMAVRPEKAVSRLEVTYADTSEKLRARATARFSGSAKHASIASFAAEDTCGSGSCMPKRT